MKDEKPSLDKAIEGKIAIRITTDASLPADSADKPKIFVLCNSCSRQWHHVMAMAEDGTHLAGHVCSDHGFISHDMGFTSDWKHDQYNRHYPDGWELVMVDDPKNHEGLQAAYELNQAMGAAAKKEKATDA